jgi:uracil-DNA glycosylase
MSQAATMIPAREAANLLAWWESVGVDMLIDEVPVPWLNRVPIIQNDERSQPAPRAKELIAAPPPLPKEAMPATLPAFTAWLMTSQSIPGAGPSYRRIAPQGAADAEIMVLVDMPEAGDVEAQQIISGEVGALFDRMLDNMPASRATIRLATLCPDRTPTGAIGKDALEQLGEIALHHIALVAPKKLWLMGEAVSRAILKMEPHQARGRLHEINHPAGTVTAMVSYHPRMLLQQPARKREAWEAMQMLMGKSKA